MDTDILIWSKDGPYPLNSKLGAPFWAFLEEGFESGQIKMPRPVFKEITEGRSDKDELALWLNRRAHLCQPSTKEIQEFVGNIGNFIYGDESPYDLRQVNRFSYGADPWLIAYAAVDKGVVVSRERRQPSARKPKVPDICDRFDVPCIHLDKLLFCLERSIKPEDCSEPFTD